MLCVDDGSKSTASTEAVKTLAAEFPKVKIIQHDKNMGKSAAVQTGLKHVTTPWVFLFDADLQGLQASEISDALQLASRQQDNLDMLILRRARYSWFVSLIRHDILMSGERLLRTADLKDVYQQKPFSGYQLEVAINHYMRTRQKRAYWFQTSLRNTYKIAKWKLPTSLLKYRDEITGYTSYAGIAAYLAQLGSFCLAPLTR